MTHQISMLLQNVAYRFVDFFEDFHSPIEDIENNLLMCCPPLKETDDTDRNGDCRR